MSCHNIGHGMNHVATEILRCFDEGKLDLETARRLIVTCRESVWFCDGNPDEAVAIFEEQRRCSYCLKTAKGARCICNFSDHAEEPLKTSIEMKTRKESYRDKMISDMICPECLKLLYDIDLPDNAKTPS